MNPLDVEMVRVAKRRGIVRLYDGRLATLISWGVPEHGRKAGTTNRIRLESQCGEHRWTAKKTEVIEVADV